MEMFKKISLYKWINIVLFLIVGICLTIMYFMYDTWCRDSDIYCVYNFYDAVYNPVFVAGKILAPILAVLLFVPSHIFRKWLFYILPIFLLLTGYFVQDTSVYSSGIGHMSRAVIAENGMYLLGFVTFLFVLGHTVYDRKKKM